MDDDTRPERSTLISLSAVQREPATSGSLEARIITVRGRADRRERGGQVKWEVGGGLG